MAAPARSARRSGGRMVTLDPEDPLIQRVGKSIEGPLVGAANILDVPGSVVRDVVQSVARNRWVNPVDQLLPWNWSSSKGRTTERQVRTSLGLGSKKSKGLAGVPADIATGIVLDPLTWVNPFGALTKAGKVAQAAGVLGDAGKVAKAAGRAGSKRAAQTSTRLAELLTTPEAIKSAERAAGGAAALEKLKSAPLRGALGYGFISSRGAVGSGKVAQKIARAQDVVGEGIRYSAPVRAVASALHKPVEGIKTKAVQIASEGWHKKAEGIRAAVRARGGKTMEEYQRLARKYGSAWAKNATAQNLRAILENPSTTKHLAGLDLPTRREFYQQFPDAEGFIDEIIARTEVMPQQAAASHLPFKTLYDVESEYFPAYKSQAVIKGGKSTSRGTQVFNTFDPSFRIERLPFRRHVAGGTEGVKRILMDPELQRMIFRSGPSGEAAVGGFVHGPGQARQVGATAIEALTSKELKNFTPAGTQELADAIEQKFGDFFDLADHPRKAMAEMANWMRTLSPAELAVGVWGNHPLADMMMRDMHVSLSTGAADTVMDTLADMEFLQAQGRSGVRVPLKDVVKEAGLDVESAMTDLAQRLGHSVENVGDMTLSKEYADDLGRFAKAFTAPDSTGTLRNAIDGFTNLFRGLVTGPWPAFHGRNFGSSQFANWVAGMWSGWSVAAAHNLQTGKGHAKLTEIPIIRDRLLAEGRAVTKEAAADMARRLVYEHEIALSNAGDIGDVLGRLGQREAGDIEDLFKEFPGGLGGTNPKRAKKFFRTAAGLEEGTSWNPLRQRGTGGRTQSEFTLSAAGEQLGSYVEGLARIAPFLDQLAKGVDPLEAARRVKAAQVDYSGRAYTAAERQIATRIFPFYKFTRGALPAHLRLLIENPGGRLAQTLRATSKMRGDNTGPLPEHIAETTAIPIPEGTPLIGPEPGGDPRYITGMGQMYEDALSLLPFGGAGLQGSGLEVASRMNPLLKGPAEFITGQSFFQRGVSGGRPLEDLDPTIGRTIRNVQQLAQGTGETGYTPPVRYTGDDLIEPLVGNLPTARLATTLRTLTDPRKSAVAKGANLMTGLHLSDVSEQAQSSALQQRAFQLLKEYPEVRKFTRQYIPKDRLPDMDEADRVDAQQLLQLLDLLAERGRERKEASKKKSKSKARR